MVGILVCNPGDWLYAIDMIYYKIDDISSLQLWCKNKLSQIEINIPEMVIQRKKSQLEGR